MMRAPHPRLVAAVRALLRRPVCLPEPPHPTLAKAVADLIRPPVRVPEAGPEPAPEVEQDTPPAPSGSS